MRVILLLEARVSVSFERLSNLNPIAEPAWYNWYMSHFSGNELKIHGLKHITNIKFCKMK